MPQKLKQSYDNAVWDFYEEQRNDAYIANL